MPEVILDKDKYGWQIIVKIGDRTFESEHFTGRQDKAYVVRAAKRVEDSDVSLLKVFGYREV